MGGFGLSVPEEYGGFGEGGESEYLGMVVATEELSRGSLGAGGSLITRPEILTRALLAGGTEEQKHEWLPKLAVGRGDGRGRRHRARLRLRRGRRQGHGHAADATAGWLINGVKTWCTFGARADVLMLLARTDPDRSKAPPRAVAVHRAEAARRRPRLRVRAAADGAAGRRQDGGPPDRHDRLPRHALLRDRVRQLVRAGRRT